MSYDKNKQYVYSKAVKAVKNSSFQFHKYVDPAHISKRALWHNVGFRGLMAHMWPYRYFLVVHRKDQFDFDQLLSPCCFSLMPYTHYNPSKFDHTITIGFTRQVDRNRQAKRLWTEVLGWAGGEFVY